ncbi:MAG: DCC1-like thiol-disulfide oxidoreductase family protein, partial [Bacteroidia bacterium]|nr:DCC1-like thiol-disulfide oxidoreductase family protein [Bacteroidia bacterium]
CNLCNSAVQFIIKRDKKNIFLFSALQSQATEQLLQQQGIKLNNTKQPESIIVLTNGKCYDKSSAALIIAKHLGLFWSLMQVFWIIPKPLRDAVYMFISRNRYKWFGKQESCMIPTPELKAKFIA